jgi:Fic family protein
MELDPGRTIFNHPNWPKFRWDETALAKEIAPLAEEEKLLSNKLNYIDPAFLDELARVAICEELLCSFHLDDEFLDQEEVKATLAAKSLAFAPNSSKISLGEILFPDSERVYINNYVNLHLDARANPDRRLSLRRLRRWRLALAHPGSLAGLGLYRPAAYGDRPARPGLKPGTQESWPAPAAARLPKEMSRFLSWHDAPWPHDPVLKAALSHLWHLIDQPFLGSTGHQARLAAELTLNGRGSLASYYSLSRSIMRDRAAYRQAFVEVLCRFDLDVTGWLKWHVQIVRQAALAANERFDLIINKAVHWAKARNYPLTERQKNVLALLGADFIGPLTAERYARVARCDVALAEKELRELVSRDLIDPRILPWATPGSQPERQDLVF